MSYIIRLDDFTVRTDCFSVDCNYMEVVAFALRIKLEKSLIHP
jgi:hypothetical protein